MKPFNSGAVISAWLLRILLIWFVYLNYFGAFTNFDFKDFDFYIQTAYLIFAALLLIGGFVKTETLTVLSGLGLFVLPIIQLIRVFPADMAEALLLYLIPLAVGFNFFTSGNNQ